MSEDRIKLAIQQAAVGNLNQETAALIREDGHKKPTEIPVFSLNWKHKVLVIDICVSKTLFGNSLMEATKEDLPLLVEKIQNIAKQKYNIIIPAEEIMWADVWYLEYRKLVLFPVRYCLHNLLEKIHMSLAKWAQDMTKVQYYSRAGNKGCKVALHTNGYEICFYDKTTRALYEGTGDDQKVYTNLLNNGYQALNYEVKLFSKGIISQQLRSVKPRHSYKFADVFDPELCKALLRHHWKQIEEYIPVAKSKRSTLAKSIYTAVLNGASIRDIVFKVGLDYLEQTLGNTLLKQLLVPILKKMGDKRRENQYLALKNKRRELRHLFNSKKEYVVQQITRYLDEFKLIRLNKYGDIEGIL